MELIKAYADENAVKVIAFAVNFAQRLSIDEIDVVIEKLKNTEYFKDEFELVDYPEEIAMTISQDGTQTHTQGSGGAIYHKLGDEGLPTWTVTINKDSILLTCRTYTRWKYISKKSFEYFNEIFKVVFETRQIAQITLEYLDEFEILSFSEDWKKELFEINSKYLPASIYDFDDFWHVNQGRFTKLDKLKQKLLDTVNINYFSDDKDELKHKINIVAQHRLGYDSENIYGKEIEDNFETIHLHSKEIFETIINNKILENFNRGELG